MLQVFHKSANPLIHENYICLKNRVDEDSEVMITQSGLRFKK